MVLLQADSGAPKTLPNSCIFSAGQYETLKQQQQGQASGMAANGGHPDTRPGPGDGAVHSEDSKPPVPKRTPRSKRVKPVLRTMRSFDSTLPSHQTVMARINEANASLASNGVHSDSESSASPSPRAGENIPNPSGTPPPPVRPTLRSLRSFDASLLQNYQVPQDDPNLAGIKSLQSRFKSLDSPGVARRARAQLDRVRDRVGLIFTAGGTGSSPGSAESTPPASPRTPRSPRIHLRRKFHFLHSAPSANDQNSVPSHTVMHKAKSSSSSSPSGHHHANKVFKRWRSKNKLLMSPTSAAASQLWSPEGNCRWNSMSGRCVQVATTSMSDLCEEERRALRDVSLARLHGLDLDCQITLPKEETEGKRKRWHSLSLKKRHQSGGSTTHGGLVLKDRGKENKDSGAQGQVFGIPLSKVIANEETRRQKKNFLLCEWTGERGRKNDTARSPQPLVRSSSSSSISSTSEVFNQSTAAPPVSPDIARYRRSRKRRDAISVDSLTDLSDRYGHSPLLDALALSSTATPRRNAVFRVKAQLPRAPQVPQFVHCCFHHLQKYGLQVLGIFRVGGSKKRIRQLREEFDSGRDVQLTEEHNPHDIGALLKEFFRDLPEPLMTKELYQAFIATRRMEDNQIAVLRLLLALLPVPNRDTLYALLQFLAVVNRHSQDSVDENGQEVPGNKMDSHNLGTLFGPNILYRDRDPNPNDGDAANRVDEQRDVIQVIKFMIENHEKLFKVPGLLYDEVLQNLLETDPEALDIILKRKCQSMEAPMDLDTAGSVFDDSEMSSLQSSPREGADIRRLHHLSEPSPPNITHQIISRVHSSPVVTSDLPIYGSRLLHPSHRRSFKTSPSHSWERSDSIKSDCLPARESQSSFYSSGYSSPNVSRQVSYDYNISGSNLSMSGSNLSMSGMRPAPIVATPPESPSPNSPRRLAGLVNQAFQMPANEKRPRDLSISTVSSDMSLSSSVNNSPQGNSPVSPKGPAAPWGLSLSGPVVLPSHAAHTLTPPHSPRLTEGPRLLNNNVVPSNNVLQTRREAGQTDAQIQRELWQQWEKVRFTSKS
ncbi:uncharacterized protein LOC144876128 isoform X2 [Branchiostoma floridae x Branchiostoma japonicum]